MWLSREPIREAYGLELIRIESPIDWGFFARRTAIRALARVVKLVDTADLKSAAS